MSNPINILVVEDDQNVALALEAMLKKGIPGSNVIRVSSCRMAMDCLESDPIRLIISDWNMPSRTGIDLLKDVRTANRTCHIPFLMVTARSDRASVVTAIQNGASDFICKPFDKASLLLKAGKLLGVRPLLPRPKPPGEAAAVAPGAPAAAKSVEGPIAQISERLKSGNLGSLMLPNVAIKIQEIVNNGEPSVDLVCDAVKLDPALTTKLIGIANSPYYLSSKRCSTLHDAIMRIGFLEATHCIMALTTKELFSAHDPMLNEILGLEWRHALATGFCAEKLAQKLAMSSAEDYFTLGLLHDIGKVLLLNILQDVSKNRPLPTRPEVVNILDTLHCDFGRELLKRWNFAQPYIDLAQYHHDPEAMRQSARGLRIVQLCNLLTQHIGRADGKADLESPELLECLQGLGLEPDILPPMLEEVEQYLAQLF